MKRTEVEVLTLTEISLDCMATNVAALEADWGEARLRCRLVAANTAAAGWTDARIAAVLVAERLGPAGTEPQSGYGAAMESLSRQIYALYADR